MASSSSPSSSRMPATRRSPESYHALNKRMSAAEILQSYEKISWYSFARNESPSQTRLHFRNIVAGFTPEDEAKLVDWKEDFTPHPTKPGEESKAHPRKGKERVSTSGAGGGAGGDGVAGPSGSPRGKGKEGTAGVDAGRKKRKSGGGSGDRRS